jgi:hypothetical protein
MVKDNYLRKDITMSLFARPKHKEQSKVPNSQYIKTESEPAKEDTTPGAKPVNPTQPEAK